jgi:hypothetical protein
MMVRNAFAIRTSETSSSDEVFARYFAPEVLTVLPENLFATSALVLRSSPGGGKTSLLRIFTPGPLLQVIRNQQHAPHDEIYRKLAVLGAVDEGEARAFGVYVPCATGYTEIGPPLKDSAARGLFRALINIRVLLRTLRAMCVLHDLDYPSGLEGISCSFNPALFFDEGPIPRDRDLSALRTWAEALESRCFASMDGIDQPRSDMPAHPSFDAIYWLSQTSFELHGQSVAAKPIVMFDDVQRLRRWQRDMLYRELLDHRSGTPVWLAERTVVLDPSEVLADATPRRDYVAVHLEHVWQKAKPRQYVQFVTSIADRRMAQMGNDLRSFGDYLAANLWDHVTQTRVNEALEQVQAKVRAAAAGTTLFDDWLRATEKHTGDPLEKAIEWTKISILIARERANRQPSLELQPLPQDEMEARAASGLPQAAERFICTDLSLPYFYGIERVVRLSSYNVEEFLQICAVLYEHIHANRITRRRGGGPVSVSAKSQHDALRKLAERRFRELPRLFPLGPQAQRLISAIGQMCRERTYEPNAPYAPGVTGIGLNTMDRSTLLKAARDGPNSTYYEVANVISSCVAQNLFEVRENLRQDNKEWIVLYLNRIFCAHYDLVYHNGGWQRVSLRRLHEWIQGVQARTGDRMSLV